MVKILSELCLDSLCFHFADISQSHCNLPAHIREALLHRLIDHDFLVPNLLPAITYNLITPALQCLDIYGSSALNDSLLIQIGIACCQLRTIRLIRCCSLTDSGLAELLVNQVCLEELELRWLLIEGHCLNNFRGSMAVFRKLSLKGCANLSSHHLLKCVINNHKISKLNLRGIRKLENQAVVQIAEHLNENLHELNLHECLNVADESICALAMYCKELRVLKLMECMNITSQGIHTLVQRCTKLQTLDISFCNRHAVVELDVLNYLPQTLSCLKLHAIQTTVSESQFVASLAKCLSLERLDLNGFSLLSDTLVRDLLHAIGKQLKYFDLSGSFDKISARSLVCIAEHCVRLEGLGLSLLSQLDGQELLPLFNDAKRASLIRILSLANCKSLSEELLWRVFENCVNLETLEVSAIGKITDNMLELFVSRCNGHLKTVLLKGNRLVTDVGVIALACRNPGLRFVSVSGQVGVTDKTIIALANHCHYLQYVLTNGCKLISPQAVNYLQDCCIGRVNCRYGMAGVSDSSIVARNLDTGNFVRLSL